MHIVQEHEKGERKKGATLVFNKCFLANSNPAASFFACFLDLIRISLFFFWYKLSSFEKCNMGLVLFVF